MKTQIRVDIRVISYICTMEKLIFQEIKEFQSSYLADINLLLAQLSSSHPSISQQKLQNILSSPNSHLYVVLLEERIIGMATLCTYLCPTGEKAWIEDVVVDSAFRGKGLGKLLVNNIIDVVNQQGNTTLMLTSRPSRIEANHLYQSLGFEKRETNVYKMTFE